MSAEHLVIHIRFAWWVTPALKLVIAWWLVRFVFTRRHPTVAEVARMSERLAKRGTVLSCP